MVAARFCAARGSRIRDETTTAMALPKSARSGESTSVPKSQAGSGRRKLPMTRSMPAQKRAAAIQVIPSAGTSAAMLLPRMILSVLA